MKKAILSILAATALVSTPAIAQNVEFTLINESGFTLTYFYASASNDGNWGSDLLEEIGVLESGYNGTVFIGDGSDQCLYDFRFETAEGPELEEFEIDICELDSYTLVAQ